MFTKSYTKSGELCRVTFRLPADVQAKTAAICGEFNNWSTQELSMKRLRDGSFSATVSLPVGRSYRFRFLLDGERWENAWEADGYAPNEHGTEDSIIEV